MELLWPLTILLILLSISFLYRWLLRIIPSRLNEEQAPKSLFSLVPIGEYPEARAVGLDIIFVHGLGSDPDTAWTAQNRTFRSDASILQRQDRSTNSLDNWITYLYHNDLSEDLRRSTRLYYFNYDSFWKRDAPKARLESVARDLLASINSGIRSRVREKNRDLMFVAHSYGGLVVKKALVYASGDDAHIRRQTKAAVFFGCPHFGTSLAAWGRLLALALRPLGSNADILWNLDTHSLPLHDLHADFIREMLSNLRVVNFYEQRPFPIKCLGLTLGQVMCVDETSATYHASKVINVSMAVDHYRLNKLVPNSSEYIMVRIQLNILLSQVQGTELQIFSLPRQSGIFTAREALMSKIHNGLKEAFLGESLAHAMVLHGLGGSGKTRLAQEFVYSCKKNYDIVLWVDARTIEDVRGSFERCAVELGLASAQSTSINKPLKHDVVVKDVLRWLRDCTQSWLMAIDNADDLTWGLQDIIPRDKRGSILVTSQDCNAGLLLFGCNVESAQVGELSEHEAQNLLLSNCYGYSVDNATYKARLLAQNIINQLGYLALVLDLAGARISEQLNNDDQMGRALVEEVMESFLQDLIRHQDYVLHDHVTQVLSPRDRTVSIVCNMTIERLAQAQPSSIRLLCLLACFRHPSSVSIDLFRWASKYWKADRWEEAFRRISQDDWLTELLGSNDTQWDDFFWRQALEPLKRYHLVQETFVGNRSITMHSLVRWKAQSLTDGFRTDVESLILLAAACSMLNKDRRLEYSQYLMPHLVHTLDVNLVLRLVPEDFVLSALIAFSAVFDFSGQHDQAQAMREFVVMLQITHKGEFDPQTLICMADLAVTYRKQSRLDDAEKLSLRVLEKRRGIFGETHPNTLMTMINLAETYRSQGRWDEAESLSFDTLQKMRPVFKNTNSDTLTVLSMLAWTHTEQGWWDHSGELDLEVLERRKILSGETHPDTLAIMSKLASIYWKQGRW